MEFGFLLKSNLKPLYYRGIYYRRINRKMIDIRKIIRNFSFGLVMSLTISLMFVSSITVNAQYKGSKVSYSDLYDSETVTSFKGHITCLSDPDLDGIKAGSKGEKSAALYLRTILKEYGVEMLSLEDGDVFGTKLENGDTLTSRNVIGFIQGYDKEVNDRYIVIGARMDNLGTNEMTIDGEKHKVVYRGANGNASGMAMMLELAKKIRTNSVLFRRSILFVGFGSSRESYAGSWYFLNRSFGDSDHIDAMINLDMLGTGYNGFYAYTASNDDMNAIVNNLENTLQPVMPKLTTALPYPSDNIAFYSKEIPSIFFTTGKYQEHDTDRDVPSIIDYEGMERELEYIYNYTLELANGPTPSFRAVPAVEKKLASDENNGLYGYYDCDMPPLFLGSADMRTFMSKWVYHYLKYPEQAVKEGIQGKVMVDFIVEKNGKISNVKVVKSVDPLLDAEALKIINASPKWKPGRVNGKKVRTQITIPIEFRLESRSKKRSFGIARWHDLQK